MSKPIVKEQGLTVIRQPRKCRLCNESFPTGTKMVRTRYKGRISYIEYVCRRCDDARQNGRINVAGRFCIGDRVRYHTDGTGNPDLDGWIGTVIYADSRDYTVEFPFAIYDGITDYRAREIGIEPKREQGWFCREEHLEEVAT